MLSRKQCLPDTTGLTETMEAYAGPTQVQIRWGPGTEQGTEHELSSLSKKLSPTDNHSHRKILFLQGGLNSCTNHTRQAPRPAVDGQLTMNSKVFLKISLSHIALFGYFLFYWSFAYTL